MFKTAIATCVALFASAPAVFADPGAIFDRHAQTARPSAEAGACYTTTGGHAVCWQRINGSFYTVSLLEVQRPEMPSTFFIKCDGRTPWESYGPVSYEAGEALATAFCQERRG